jgi:hypothetical protein
LALTSSSNGCLIFFVYEKETRALKVWDFNLLVESLGDGCLAFLIHEKNTLAFEAQDLFFLLATSSGDGPRLFSSMRKKPKPSRFQKKNFL